MTEFNRAFADTCSFIYYLERNPTYYEATKGFFSLCYSTAKVLVTSAVTIEEYSIVPYRNSDYELLTDFNRFLSDMKIQVLNIDRVVADRAAQIRAAYPSFKPMDALQLAAAVQIGCDLFLTNDRQLRQFTELPVLLIQELP